MAEPGGFVEYKEGDTFAYRSVTQGHIVTWTRDVQGVWRADDGREGTVSDHGVRIAQHCEDTDTDWPTFARRILRAGQDPAEAAALERDTMTAILGLDAQLGRDG